MKATEREGTAMRPWRLRRWHRALAVLALALLVSPTLVQPGVAQADDLPDPILFVHGFRGNASRWSTMIERFEADGWPADRLFAITYDSTKSNADIAADVGDAVDAILATTGAPEVDIVAMSMGSLNSRYYLKFLGGAAVVDDWVSLAGPNHGTRAANLLCFGGQSVPCEEMKIGSAFLAQLNAGDETPGSVSYGTFWSPCDSMINPLSGEGISYGIASARELMRWLPDSLDDGAAVTVALRSFDRWFRHAHRVHFFSCVVAHRLMGNPWWAKHMIRAADRDPLVFQDALQLLFGKGRIHARTVWRILRNGW
jgi:triacylglycerol lipase